MEINLHKFHFLNTLAHNEEINSLSIKQQREIIRQCEKKHSKLIANEFWCLVEISWYKKWQLYSEQQDLDESDLKYPKPGFIDNSPLLDNKNELRKGILENRDYTLIHENTWDLLFKIYGGNKKIRKRVIEVGPNNKKIVEIHLLRINYTTKVGGSKGILNIRRNSKLSRIWELLSKKIKTPVKDIKLYFLDSQIKSEEIEYSKDTTLYDSKLQDNDHLLVETNSNKSTNSRKRIPLQSNNASEISNDKAMKTEKKKRHRYPTRNQINSVWKTTKPEERGLTGLSNLGNTCFMNSGLQCLLNTIPVRNYFLSGRYLKEINETNPIGSGGKLSHSFADLMKLYWAGESSVITPRNLKYVIGRFAPQFSGYAQQDSQELISFLLDGLHEDLNRIIKKPSTSDIDGKNCKDLNSLATNSWVNYKKRNDSFFVDHFQGLLRNRLICPICKVVSFKFDPLMYLTIPLPSTREFHLDITLVPYDRRKPLLIYHISINKSQGLEGVLNKISMLSSIEAENLKLIEIYRSGIFQEFLQNHDLDKIRQNDIIAAYELYPLKNTIEETYIPVNFELFEINKSHRFGWPVFIKLPLTEINSNVIYSLCLEKIKEIYSDFESNIENIQDDGGSDEEWGGETCKVDDNRKDITNNKKKIENKNKNEYEKENEKERGKEKEKGIEIETENGNENGNGNGNGNEKKNKEQKIKNFGFEYKKKTPYFVVTMSKYDHRSRQEIEIIKPNTKIEIRQRMRLSIRINPYLIPRIPNMCKQFEMVQKHSSYLKHYEKINSTKTNGTKSNGTNSKNTRITLDDCLKTFLEQEKLNQQNMWYCPDCKKHVCAWIKYDIWKLPEILIIHLKRFSETKFSRKKIAKFVNFPEVLDMEKYILSPKNNCGYKYELYAISNHYGGVGSGHYTATLKNETTNKWFNFNDSSVTEIDSLKNIITQNAYVLFYRRKKQLQTKSHEK
ncbi:ubiquitin carboxyl-terminal hydrolase [Anaeramoeba flamelloides]|uniref:Ubiquitin carboxyl-terminal hydrolase n=1 Tax=Anaeramoeba flamelloides TaxID=1746091 RepID=A0ABQ8Y2T7_9EUKA|nr:ubiquitin carboxyl-terminal hydrolase [Anaeramoeba flamelloides]